jgi:two-component system cell cycle sensor histidine kinase/response regulator CckA
MNVTTDNGQGNEPLVSFLSLVREIAADAAAQSDPDTCLRHLRAGLLRLGFNRAGIWVTDPDDPTRIRGTWGTDWHGEEVDEHSHNESIREQFGHSFLELDEPIRLNRVSRLSDPGFASDDWVIELSGPPNQAAISLRADGAVVGLISVDMLPTDRTIDPDQVAALVLVADVAAIAVARGRAVDRLRAANEELQGAVAASREAEARYRTISELGSDYTYVIEIGSDGTAETKWITDSVERVTGYTPGEVIDDRARPRIVHPDDIAMVEANARRVLAGESTTIEHRIVTKSGEIRWVRLHRRPGWDAEMRRVVRIYVATEDITEAKRAEAASREREQTFRLLFENNPHPMWVYDLHCYRFLAVNNAAVENYGYGQEEFLQMSIPDLVIPEEAARVAPVIAEVERIGRQTGRWRHRRKDGTIVEVHVASHSLEFEGQDAAIGIAFDITDQVRAANALRESEERFRFMAEATGDALYRLRFATNRYDYMSPAVEQLTGYTVEEINDDIWPRIVRRVVTPAEASLSEFPLTRERSSGDEMSYHAHYLIQTKAGDERWLEDRSEPWRDQTGAVVGSVGVLSDITERQILEEQLRQAQKMEAIGQLAGGVAHDFNNLLTVIRGYGQLLLVQLDPETFEYSEVEQITEASETAAALTRQLLAFSRRQVIAPKEVDLNAIIEQVSMLLRRIIGEDITFTTSLASHLDRVWADPSQVEQILMTLANNARDAMPSGGKLAVSTQNVDLDEGYVRYHPEAKVGPHVMLGVSDTGRGIDEATRSRLFEPFFTTKEFGHGTGLSLAAVYGIVRQNGGSIEVASEPGAGTSFRLYFPRLNAATPNDGAA